MGKGDAAFIDQFLSYIAKQSYNKHAPLREIAPHVSVPPELISELLAGALLGALRWWIKDDMRDTPLQMAYRFSQVIAPGVLQVMGLDDGGG